MTAVTTIGQRGLVRIPSAARAAAQFEEGSEVLVLVEGPGCIRLATREAIRDEVWNAAPASLEEPDTQRLIAMRTSGRSRVVDDA